MISPSQDNLLLTDSVEDELAARGILWIPDYVANAGGLIQAAAEIFRTPLSPGWLPPLARRASPSASMGVQDRIGQLESVVEVMLADATSESITPGQTARRIAEERLNNAKGTHS